MLFASAVSGQQSVNDNSTYVCCVKESLFECVFRGQRGCKRSFLFYFEFRIGVDSIRNPKYFVIICS